MNNKKCGEIFVTDNGLTFKCTISIHEACNWTFLKLEEFSSHIENIHKNQMHPPDTVPLEPLLAQNDEDALPKETAMIDVIPSDTKGTVDFGDLGVYSCELCLKTLNVNENFVEHKKLHTNEKNFKCPECALWFFKSDDFSIHINTGHEYSKNRTSFDNVYNQILQELDMKENSSSDYQAGLESCEFCNFQDQSFNVLKKHKKKMHTESQLFVCKKCPRRRFKEKYQIVDHLKKHLIIHSCSFCDKKFNDKYKLDVHIRRHNNIRPFVCSICKRGFPTKTEKTTHERNHTENRAFVCEICGNGFKTVQYLWVHKKTHEDKRTYVCPDCGKAFNTASVLKCHRYIHLEVKPFPCDLCDKAFNKRWTLKVHRRLHFDELYYTCDICVRGFKQHGSYKAHMKSHTNEKNKT